MRKTAKVNINGFVVSKHGSVYHWIVQRLKEQGILFKERLGGKFFIYSSGDQIVEDLLPPWEMTRDFYWNVIVKQGNPHIGSSFDDWLEEEGIIPASES